MGVCGSLSTQQDQIMPPEHKSRGRPPFITQLMLKPHSYFTPLYLQDWGITRTSGNKADEAQLCNCLIKIVINLIPPLIYVAKRINFTEGILRVYVGVHHRCISINCKQFYYTHVKWKRYLYVCICFVPRSTFWRKFTRIPKKCESRK